jgi:hypothetical protein
MVWHSSGQRCRKPRSHDGMNKSPADSYHQKLSECRLDPVGDPLIHGVAEPSRFSSGFSTSEVVAKALGWQQELAARVREIQERPDVPFEQKTDTANFFGQSGCRGGTGY